MSSPLIAELTDGSAVYIEDPMARAAVIGVLTLADLEIARSQIEKEPHIVTQVSLNDLNNLENRAEELCDIYRAIATASCRCDSKLKLFSWLFGNECDHHKNAKRATGTMLFFMDVAQCRTPAGADGSG